MRCSMSVCVLRCLVVMVTILFTASEGKSQSLQFVTGVSLETSYVPEEAFTVRAVYGDFMNNNSVWVQLWRETSIKFTYELVWQARVSPSVGDGQGEWVTLPENSWVSMVSQYRLGVMNDVIPGPLLEKPDFKSNMILTDISTDVKGLAVGDKVSFDDLGFPYHIPLYLCNRTDCRNVRQRLGRLTHEPRTTEHEASSSIKNRDMSTESATKAHLEMTLVTEVTTEQPDPVASSDDELFNRATMIGILLGLGILSLILLVIIVVLVVICVAIDRRKRREQRYSSHIPVVSSGGLGLQVNDDGFDSIRTDRSDTSSKRLVTRDLPEQTIMVY